MSGRKIKVPAKALAKNKKPGPRLLNQLSAIGVAKAKTPGARLADGGNLYLRISKTGVKSWTFMYSVGATGAQRGRQYELGLGPYPDVSLADARVLAEQMRNLRREGRDPMEIRLQDRLRMARTITFDDAAKAYIAAKKSEWKNAKHAEQWQVSLDTYVSPKMGRFSVAAIDTDLVMKCLTPIWEGKTETATRVRGRIERILDWSAVQKYRSQDLPNPARWAGNLEHLLAAPGPLKRVEHHPALPYSEIGAFMADLRVRPGDAARALEFTILTASRSGEARGARWGEIDFSANVWTVPGERMKMKKEHRVPLSSDAVKLLQALKVRAGEVAGDELVFPGPKKGLPFSDAAMMAVLKRMDRSDITVHGFRSTFRDWAAECTAYPQHVCEMALAHSIGDKVEAAYRRGELIEKRTRLMEDWAAYCNNVQESTDNVIPLQKGNAAA